MDLQLEGKTVIVTGGGSNIGRATSLLFAKEKCNVVVAELNDIQGAKVAEACKEQGAKDAVCIKCDVTKWDQVTGMVKKTLDTYGTVDILVNVAGGCMDRLFMEKTREELEKEIQLNFWSVINCTRAVLDHMTEKKKGAIVSIGSDAGRMGEYREAVYGGTKGAVIAMSKSLARELGPKYGIRVNVVCPGMTVPRRPEEIGEGSNWAKGSQGAEFMPLIDKIAQAYPLRKVGRPEDIAHMVCFLASDLAAGHITGQTISVSGGYTMA